MTTILKKRLLPLLLILTICIGMVPAVYADAEITTTDTPTSEILTEILPEAGDVTVVPNDQADDLTGEVTPPDSTEEPSASESMPDASGSASSIPPEESSPAGSDSTSVPESNSASSDSIPVDSNSAVSADGAAASSNSTLPEEEAERQMTAIIEGRFARAAGGKLTIHKYPAYQWDMGLGMEGTQMHPWYIMDIDGRVAYCIEPFNHDTHSNIQYGTISYSQLSSTQRYAIGYIMLYGASGMDNPLFHMATQVAIWEVTEGIMNLETFESYNHRIYDATIGRNPSAAGYYEQILASVRSHTQVPSFAHFFTAMAPIHKMLGIPGEYKLDLVNTNPNCSLADFNFTGDGNVSFAKDGETLHVTAAGAVSAASVFSAYKGAAGATDSLVFWGAGAEQVRATAGILDPVPCHFRLSTEDVGRYTIEITKLELGTNIPLAGAEFEVRHAEKGMIGTFTTDGSGKVIVSVPWQGTYIVTELTPPKNHKLDDNFKKEAVVSTDTPAPQVTFHNEKFSGLQIVKVDGTTKARIAGVTFRVARKGGGEYQDVVTGESGIASLPNLQPDWYTITEISCPPGYILDATPRMVELKNGEVTAITIENFAKPSLEITKVDADNPNLILPGATFRVAKEGSMDYRDITTGPDGIARLTGMEPGFYSIREIVAPSGYLLSDVERVVEIVEGRPNPITIPNSRKCGIEILKVDTDHPAVPLAGASFTITNKGTGESFSAASDMEGIARLTGLEPGFYEIVEVVSPEGYLLNETPYTLEVLAGKIATITIPNSKQPGLDIVKVDEADPNRVLAGATFRVARKGGKETWDITTDGTGVAHLTGLQPDYYVVRELVAPDGYILSDKEHTVEIRAGEVATLKLSNGKKPSLALLKIDSITQQPLAGATFEIGYKNGAVIGRFTSDADGRIELPQMDPGLVVVTEIAAPEGYIITNAPQEVLLGAGDVKELRFENRPKSPIILKKVDAEGHPLADASFRLTKMNGELVGEYTTGRNGYITVPELEPGWYTAVETKAPDGYKLNDTPQNVELKLGDPAILEFENEVLPSLQLYKYDSVTKKPIAGVTLRVEKLSGERVGDFKTNQAGLVSIPNLESGAYVAYEIATIPGYQLDTTPQTVQLGADGRGYLEFANVPLVGLTIQKLDSVTKKGIAGVEFLVSKLSGETIGTFTTDGGGRIFIPNLEEQYVKVRELSAPEGYQIDGSEKIVALKAGEANTVAYENHPYPYLVIYKLGQDGQPLPGVKFTIANDAGRELGTYTTNNAGRIVLTGIDAGHYVVQEVEPAEGYELDATPYDVYLQWGKTTQIKLKNKELGSLSLMKVSAEDEKQVLPGATFLLYDAKNNLVGEYTTDENGEIRLDHQLKAGTYTLKEIKAPAGFVLDEQTKQVELRNGETVRLTWPNTPERGRIQITKISAAYNDLTKLPAGAPLSSAVFEIFTPDNKVVDTLTTNDKGLATSKLLPLGTYGIREVTAPQYYLLNGKVIFVELKVHQDLIQLKVEDANEDIGVEIKKTGNVEAMPGDLIRYDFDGIRNLSNVPLDKFYWRDILPVDAVTLQEISTGTWSEDLTYKVLYRTNLSQDDRVLAEGLHTTVNNRIDCKAAAVGLGAGEVITEFRFEFGTVQPGFEPVTKPYIKCLVNLGLPNEYRFRNCTDVGGKRGEKWVIAKDCWVTVVYALSRGKLPKTGR